MTISDEKVEEIKEELDLIVASCSSSPFLMSLLQKSQVYASELVPTAGVDKSGSLYVNPEYWDEQDKKRKVFVIIHEVLHLAFQHPWRFDGVEYKMLANVGEDSVINETIGDHGRSIPNNAASARTIEGMVDVPADEIRKMSAEEVYELLQKKMKEKEQELEAKVRRDVYSDRRGGDKQGGASKGGKKKGSGGGGDEEGDEKIVRKGTGSGNEEEAEKKWRENLARAAVAAKQAGNLPGNVERLVDELLQSVVPWKSLLRQAVRDGLNGNVIATWKRPSRRFPNMLPGLKRKNRDIFVLVDTSGSIGPEELKRYLSEIYTLSSMADVTVYPWDARAYEPIDVSNSKDAVTQMELKGGGGTVIRPVLKKVKRKRPNTVVILSDGVIGDLQDGKTRKLLKSVGSKATEAIFLTTYNKVDVQGWRTIKIEEKE